MLTATLPGINAALGYLRAAVSANIEYQLSLLFARTYSLYFTVFNVRQSYCARY